MGSPFALVQLAGATSFFFLFPSRHPLEAPPLLILTSRLGPSSLSLCTAPISAIAQGDLSHGPAALR